MTGTDVRAGSCGYLLNQQTLIMGKLDHIKEKYPGYMENISFNAVLDEKNDFQCISNFLLMTLFLLP